MFRIIRRKWDIKRGQHARSPGAKGQSLVEMAIITPLLILMFIGALEVGWAIRGYVVLVNADREATRFAARGQYLDFSQTERENVGYGRVLSHTLTSISQQLPFDVVSDEPNGTLIISHYQVKTGKPCADPPCNDDCEADHNNKHGGCDCTTPERREPDYPYDDLVLYPGTAGYEHFAALYGIPRESRIQTAGLVAKLKEQNDAFNCSLNGKDPSVPWSANSVVVVEGEGPVADRYAEFFDADPARANIAEVAFGVNDRAEVTGEVLEDEKAGFHWAYGRSDHLGGVVGIDAFKSPDMVIHQDIVYAQGNPITVARADLVGPGERRTTVIHSGDYVLW